MRFPRQRRITTRHLFQRVKSEGRSWGGRFLVLGVLSDPVMAPSVRVGYITTKRLGNAVARNRVRRRLRGILQRTGERLKPGYCLVLIARHSAAEASSIALEKEWKWLAHRAGIFQEKSDRSGQGETDREPSSAGPNAEGSP
ncbi:MAG: ribonuclease P protein component [Verrucomicrobiae bacterium]|nr:ribonuclease P protein component [Verrucomicrobiae bacterium]